jgi:hypothetical protein
VVCGGKVLGENTFTLNGFCDVLVDGFATDMPVNDCSLTNFWLCFGICAKEYPDDWTKLLPAADLATDIFKF